MAEYDQDGYGPAPAKPDEVLARPPSLEQHAREMYGLDREWQAYAWTAHGDYAAGYTELKGGVFREVLKTGKRAGTPNFKKPEPGHPTSVAIPVSLHKKWIADWENQTGFCARCEGSGMELVGWSASKGNRYRPCAHCCASGSRPALKAGGGGA